METLLGLLKEFDDNSDIAEVIERINEIKLVFDQIQVITSKVEPITDPETRITTLKAKSDIFISESVFDSLLTKVDKIRTEFVR